MCTRTPWFKTPYIYLPSFCLACAGLRGVVSDCFLMFAHASQRLQERVSVSLAYEMAQVADSFRRFDVDNSGKLDSKEFRYMCLRNNVRYILGAPGLTTRNKKLLGAPGLTTRNKKLLGAPGLTTRNKKLLGAPGLTTRNKKLLGAPGLTTRNKKLLGAPGLTTRNKKLLGAPGLTTRNKKLLGAPGLTTRNALLLEATRGPWPYY